MVQVDQRAYAHLVEVHCADLAHHLQELGVEVSGPLPGWLLSGWVNCLPFQTAMRLWDCAFYERSGAVFFR
jgi:hypothetical protein